MGIATLDGADKHVLNINYAANGQITVATYPAEMLVIVLYLTKTYYENTLEG